MVLALVLITLVVFILLMLTWYNISEKADLRQYAATCSRIDSDRMKLRHLESLHEGYGPTKPHVAALDQIVTLQLRPAPTPSEVDYFVIPSPDTYKTCYAMATDSSCADKPQSTERSVTLRELLNRLLKDVPVQLVDSVEADWKFVEEPTAPPYVLHMPAPTFDNRPHPLHGVGVAHAVAAEPIVSTLVGGYYSSLAAAPFPLFNDHN